MVSSLTMTIFSAIVTLLTNKPLDRRVHFHIDESSMTTIPASSNATKPNKGLFSVSQIGDIMLRKPLDYEQHRQYSFLVCCFYSEVINSKYWPKRKLTYKNGRSKCCFYL